MSQHAHKSIRAPNPSETRAKTISRPALKLRSVERYSGRVRAAEIFDTLLSAHIAAGQDGWSNASIGNALGVSEKSVREMRTGMTAVQLGDLFALPRSTALALVDMVRTEVANDGIRSSLSPEALFVVAASEFGDVATALREALPEGLSQSERLRLVGECQQARAAIEALEQSILRKGFV